MKKIADELNENIRATENRLTMIKIQKNFVNDINVRFRFNSLSLLKKKIISFSLLNHIVILLNLDNF